MEKDTNPFSMVVMAHLKAQQFGKEKENQLKQWKLILVRMLYERGYSRKDILELFRFIDWLVVLPENLDREFWEEVKNMEEENRMPYVSIGERIGMQKGKQEIVRHMLTQRFGKIPEWADKRLVKASSDEIILLADRMLDGVSIEDIFSELTETEKR